ncbi:tyrosine-type recombinase/integrase [Glycocaulis abyssi]|uniref:Tyrosine-type recombinase/integrase n=1 Tax=Glycocaulis abyssi TaxID=1433403 RepID=A0ABV9NHA0_9PROT
MAGGINKLTDTAVKAKREPGYYGDGGGLWLQVSRLGGKSWVFRFTRNGRTREMGLGAFISVSLKRAREKAADCRRILDEGGDPIEVRKAERMAIELERARSKTFRECAEVVIETKEKELVNPKHKAQWRSSLETYAYPVLADKPVSSITVDDVKKVLEPIWSTKHETARRVRSRMEAVFDSAKDKKLMQGDNPAEWRGSLKELGKLKIKRRHHPALPYAQVGEFMAELRKRDGMAAKALEFAILCASRSGEVRGATWDEIDLKARLWVIPAERMKADKKHRVPLSDAAVKLLEGLKDIPRIKGAPLYVFPAARGGMLSDMSLSAVTRRMHADRLKAGKAGWVDGNCGDPVVPHGFRSTFRDWAGETTSYPREVIEHALAHQLKDDSEAAYARETALPKRAPLMQDWANYCANLAKPSNVVAISEAVGQ